LLRIWKNKEEKSPSFTAKPEKWDFYLALYIIYRECVMAANGGKDLNVCGECPRCYASMGNDPIKCGDCVEPIPYYEANGPWSCPGCGNNTCVFCPYCFDKRLKLGILA